METKVPPPPSPVQQVQQPLGQAVVFKADKSAGKGVSLSPRSVKTILAGVVMLFLVGGVGVGVYLVGQQQQIKSKASNDSTIPDNIKSIVPGNAVNPTATKSASVSASKDKPASSQPGSLSSIVVPELEPSDSSSLNASSSAAELAEFDFNQDGQANSVDLSVMYSGWGTPKNELQNKADINGDGFINGIDYSLFLQHFNEKL